MRSNLGKYGARKKNCAYRQLILALSEGLNLTGYFAQRRPCWSKSGNKPASYERGALIALSLLFLFGWHKTRSGNEIVIAKEDQVTMGRKGV